MTHVPWILILMHTEFPSRRKCRWYTSSCPATTWERGYWRGSTTTSHCYGGNSSEASLL